MQFFRLRVLPQRINPKETQLAYVIPMRTGIDPSDAAHFLDYS